MNVGKTTLTLLIVGALTGCTTVQKTVGQWTGSDLGLSKLDANDDGVISQQEAEQNPGIAEAFDRIDTNRDQNINPEELRAAYTRVAEVNFEQLDFNGDGVVSQREAEAVPPSLHETFDRVDADGDSNVSQAEYEAARLNLLGQSEFAAFDTDGDGVIDEQEAEDDMALSEDFDSIDIDSDGMLSDQEFERARQR